MCALTFTGDDDTPTAALLTAFLSIRDAANGGIMIVHHGLPTQPPTRPGAVAFGNFDGVHRGHRAIIDRLRANAAADGGLATVVTFDPHPLSLLAPQRAPAAIDTLAGRLSRLDDAGAQAVIVMKFDDELRDRSAAWFAREVLCRASAASVVTAGYDCRFGRGGEGDFELLRVIAAEEGARVELFDAVRAGNEIISSSKIRQLIAAGDVELAAQWLGRPFALRGQVVRGDALGRTIGFPTANVSAPFQLQPAAGVYAAWLRLGARKIEAVCNAGVRPTVDAGTQWRVEAHCFDFDEDIYDAEVSLELVARLRDERRFDGLDALKSQIANDCRRAKQVLRKAA